MTATLATDVQTSRASRPVVRRAQRWLVRLGPGASTASAMAVLSAMALAWSVAPLVQPVTPVVRFEPMGVQVVSHPDSERIDAVLARRGPGLGLRLRQQLAVAISEEARAANFDPLLILAIIDVESEFRETAVSNMNARGLMQIQPVTLQYVAEREGIKLTAREIEADPALRVRLGIRYLKYLASRFGNDLDVALMAYNAGPTRVQLAARQRGELEQFRNYVRAVRREYAVLKREHGEAGDWAFAARESASRPQQ
ncbi:MAG: lytic transglycosylase domain-containing protein [Myxococcales bacterium]|nr:lytic transglycosylase domain-containing protein [Myxococcales bacterium]MDP3501765.1 lytic transglycosylase domain-containing protein [Myxococcales bacterium]